MSHTEIQRGCAREGATHLLAETDARAAVEGEEDERVRDQVLADAFVQEAVRVELVGCRYVDEAMRRLVEARYGILKITYPWGPSKQDRDAC